MLLGRGDFPDFEGKNCFLSYIIKLNDSEGEIRSERKFLLLTTNFYYSLKPEHILSFLGKGTFFKLRKKGMGGGALPQSHFCT